MIDLFLGPPFFNAHDNSVLLYRFLAAAPLLASPSLPRLLPFPASEGASKPWFQLSQILFTVPLLLVFHPNEHPPSFDFQKAC